MSTMDNASAQLAIALQLQDLNELEVSGAVDKFVIRLQRQQLEIDSGFDAVTFEASRRLALSMAKAVKDDSVILNQLTRSRQIDRATFDRLALLNRSSPTLSNAKAPQPKSTNKRLFSEEPHTDVEHRKQHHKKVRTEQFIGDQTSATTVIETATSTADCASCSDHLTTDKLVKAACEHYYCKDCFGQFIEASLQTHDGFPPKCCKIPIPFVTIAANVSAAIYSRYSARQAEIKNATALYCGVQRCGVKIENDRIKGVRATCVACWRDTCTLCRGEFPKRVDGKNVGHACKKDEAREQVLAMAKEEGWQTCYQCGHLVALNTGCHHMT